MRVLAVCILLLGHLVLSSPGLAQQNDSDQDSATAFCDFEDGQEISVRYSTAPVSSKDEPRNGKLWVPGGKPMTLFTGATVALNNTAIPAGAYTLYLIPNKKEWTLIVNKNVTSGSAYDEHQDVARGPMDLGEVDSPPRQMQVSFAHTGPKVCSIRVYYGKVGAFTEFNEK